MTQMAGFVGAAENWSNKKTMKRSEVLNFVDMISEYMNTLTEKLSLLNNVK